jgi:4-amino-4-deoxy-L-arabinose transferase-like glycosyltransferase
VGVVAYLLIVGRGRRALTRPYMIMGLGAAAPVAGFLVAREQASHGYLHATLFNDVAGRFSTSLDRHGGPPGAYLNVCFTKALFSCGWAAAAAPFALRIAKGRVRLGLIFSLFMTAAVLGIDSLAATKLLQYAEPAYPFLAIACALAVHVTLKNLEKKSHFSKYWRHVALGLMLCFIIGRAAAVRYVYIPAVIYQPQAKYGELFASLSRLGAKHVRAIDDGVWGPGIPKGYMPQLRAEIMMWRPLGLDVVRVRDLSESLATPDSYTVTCDPNLIGALRPLGRDVGAVSDCVALPPHPR